MLREADTIEIVVTYLEMRRPPAGAVTPRLDDLAILRAQEPTVSFYRYLYNTVGEPWLWYERRLLSDEALREIIHAAGVSVYVLYSGGVPAGFSELDARADDEVEIAYFGLIPEFIGRGLGDYFLRWTVDKAWSLKPRRVWVHTCSLDHPKALVTYQKAGFTPCRRETKHIRDPRLRLFPKLRDEPAG